MALIVKKFGGTSLATPSHIMHLAGTVRDEIDRGNKIVIIVSAMNKTTDELTAMASEICDHPNKREMDMLLTTGERISMALFSMALNSYNIKSYSYTGSQVGIITTPDHTDAKIIEIRGTRLKEALKKNITPIIAGFQGVSASREITTLGRGGSDTTATAIASYLSAERCEIYTDVDGVYTVDPHIVYNAKHVKEIAYEEMLIMASTGSRILHPRSVEIAMKNNLKLCVKSSFNEGVGTMITDRNAIEGMDVRGISHRENLTALNIKTNESIMDIIKLLSENDMDFEMFANKSQDAVTLITDSNSVSDILARIEEKSESISINNDLSIITIIGSGLYHNKDVLKKILRITDKYKNDIFTIIKDELKFSIVTKKPYLSKLLSELSEELGLTDAQ
ncbi:MAG: aspartate kinase [bacterium]